MLGAPIIICINPQSICVLTDHQHPVDMNIFLTLGRLLRHLGKMNGAVKWKATKYLYNHIHYKHLWGGHGCCYRDQTEAYWADGPCRPDLDPREEPRHDLWSRSSCWMNTVVKMLMSNNGLSPARFPASETVGDWAAARRMKCNPIKSLWSDTCGFGRFIVCRACHIMFLCSLWWKYYLSSII